MYYVYVLKSLKDNRHYIGYSRNVQLRLKQHNTGQVKSMKYRVPLEVIYLEEYKTSIEARKRESTIKRMKNGIQFKDLLNMLE